jgi:Ca2+-binding RTX toxin-like protein
MTRRASGIAAASSGVAAVSLGGAIPISVGAVSSTQVRGCVDGRSVASGSSNVDALVIAGIPVPVIAGQSIDIGVAGVRVRTNVVEGDTRRALVLDLLGSQVVLGEATAAGDACASTSGDGGGSTGGPGGGADGAGSSASVCPQGADYQVDRNLCVITVPGTGGRASETIVVGKPFSGPSGGTVVALSEARAMVAAGRLEASSCLSGKGPAFVILGGTRTDRITGTNGTDRILSRGGSDRVGGGRGDDCVDGGSGNDRLDGSAGADRVYGSAGRDNLNGGAGSDRLSGGAGNDTINTAYGRDKAFGGGGRDAINAATAGPAATVSGGPGRDVVRINLNERRKVRGAEVVHTLR